jgi:hypothetical protein
MRRVLFLLSLIVPLSVAQVSDATPASVEGQVVSATTGQPIRRATVQLVRSGQGVAGLALSDDA